MLRKEIDIKNFTAAEITAILDCERLDLLTPEMLSKEKRELLYQSIDTQRPTPAKKAGNLAQNLLYSLESASYPIDTWWLILGTVEAAILGTAALPITLSFLALGVIWFGYKLFFSQRKIKKQRQEDENFFQTADIKCILLKKLIQDNCKKMNDLGLTELEESHIQAKQKKFIPGFDPTRPETGAVLPETIVYTKNSSQPVSKRKSIFKGLGAFFVLALTTLATATLFQMLGYFTYAALFAILFATPHPLAIAIFAGIIVGIIGVGIYVGIKHYQESKHNQCLEENKSLVKSTITGLTNTFNALKKIMTKLTEKRDQAKQIEKLVEIKTDQQVKKLKDPYPTDHQETFFSMTAPEKAEPPTPMPASIPEPAPASDSSLKPLFQ